MLGEMCVAGDTVNKVGRTKIDLRGKISLFVGYSTQHAGDVYRLVNPKTSRVIPSRDVKLTGKAWAEFYKIKMIVRVSGYVDPDEDVQLEEEDQDNDQEESETKMIQNLFKLVNQKQKNQQRPQLEWQMMSQWLQGQEAKLQQMNQLQQEQDKHLDQILK